MFHNALILQVQTGSNPSSVKFKSNLFGSLAAGLFVAPNMIDFDTVFDNLDHKIVDVSNDVFF